jgi:hypothetical protein
LRDGDEGTHFELDELVDGVDFAGEADLGAHGGGALAEFGGGEDVTGFVNEDSGEVLAFGDDDAFVEALLHLGFVGLAGFFVEDCDGAEAGVLAVAAVGVDVELGEESAFGDGAGDEITGEGVDVLVRESHVFWEGDGDVADAAGLGEADCDSGGFADLLNGEAAGLTEADDEEAFGFDVGGGVEEEGLAESGFELSGDEPGGGCARDGVGGAEESGGGGVACGRLYVYSENGEQRGDEGSGVLELESNLHSFMVSRRVRLEGIAGAKARLV